MAQNLTSKGMKHTYMRCLTKILVYFIRPIPSVCLTKNSNYASKSNEDDGDDGARDSSSSSQIMRGTQEKILSILIG
jgi:hypothetical protein